MITKSDIKYFRRLSNKSYFIRFNIEMAIMMVLIIAQFIFFMALIKECAESDGQTFRKFFEQYMEKNAEERYKSSSFSEAVEYLGGAWTDMALLAIVIGIWCHHGVHIKRCQRILKFVEDNQQKISDSVDEPLSPKT